MATASVVPRLISCLLLVRLHWRFRRPDGMSWMQRGKSAVIFVRQFFNFDETFHPFLRAGMRNGQRKLQASTAEREYLRKVVDQCKEPSSDGPFFRHEAA